MVFFAAVQGVGSLLVMLPLLCSSFSANPFAAAAAVAISAATAQLINIKSHVPVTLDLGDSNFGTWRTFYLFGSSSCLHAASTTGACLHCRPRRTYSGGQHWSP